MVDTIEEAGVSKFMSSLMLEELPRGNPVGGGVRTRSSKEFQNSNPAEFFNAWFVKLWDGRLSNSISVVIASSGVSSIVPEGPMVTGSKVGEEAEVVG